MVSIVSKLSFPIKVVYAVVYVVKTDPLVVMEVTISWYTLLEVGLLDVKVLEVRLLDDTLIDVEVDVGVVSFLIVGLSTK